ncbi:hypothetical protein DSM106972_032340 [Dulcicalothrix desertica PCC 7102]|uniref:Spore coat protein U domain-containing protein n=1 Tax=Dulcicalothrix desertica PCC 7102 TaxID=232991 RepID=A0A3S1CMX8_9CYAN|nr:hypothetical protein [Dulcicalothrix desertica]RUT06028.1 hypothetical protein DSM106972_032340 [Dulcicalothrix desertica PCC 7102]TWH54306.1 hypothetical protein CAL7102_02325 [Dulcicalothrix desertica PCC 7102]
MIRRILFILTIIITANVGTSKSVVASEKSKECSFTQTNPGVLVSQGNPSTKLVSFSEVGGTPTQMNVTCYKPVFLSVSAPIQVSGHSFTPVSSFAIVRTPQGNSTKTGDAPVALPEGTTPIQINFSVDRGRRLRSGNYRYIVKFTVVTQ